MLVMAMFVIIAGGTGGLKVEAAQERGFKIKQEHLAGSKKLGGPKATPGCTDPKNDATDLGYATVTDVDKANISKCLIAYYIAPATTKETSGNIIVKYTDCEYLPKEGGVSPGKDVWCKTAEKLDAKLEPTGAFMEPVAWKMLDSDCKSENDKTCTAKQTSCFSYYVEPIQVCDYGPNGEFTTIGLEKGVGENSTTKVLPSDNGWACRINIKAGNLTSSNKSTYGKWICNKTGDAELTNISSDDPRNVCQAIVTNDIQGTKANCNPGKITFSDSNSLMWYHSITNDDTDFNGRSFVAAKGDGVFIRVNELDIQKSCTITGEISQTGNVNCSKVTKAQFFEKVKSYCIEAKAKNPKVNCEDPPKGTSASRTGNTGADGAQSEIDSTNNKSVEDAKNQAKNGNPFEAIFSFLYQFIAAIIMVFLFIIRYLQMEILLLFISVMTVLLNLSPNTGFLTTLAVPLWSIFAQIASLGAVGLLIFYGSATMIGIKGYEYNNTIAKGAKVAIYVFVSNFTYFGLAFAISLLDGFSKLIVFVFGGGSVFKLFEALIASVSGISKIRSTVEGGGAFNLVPDIGSGLKAVGSVFGKGSSDITTILVAEIIVVVGLGVIIWAFGRIFFMLLTRVAILLLLLITSPIWVLGVLVGESLPQQIKSQVDKALSLVGGTIVFNFAFIITLVLVTIITQKINGGIADFQKTITDALVPQTNSGLALLNGVNASAATGLSEADFLGFGAGGFGNTISVCAVLAINIAIIYFAFDSLASLIDTSIQSVGASVSKGIGRNLQNFRKADSFGQGIAMMGQDAFKYGKQAVTGGNDLIADGAGAGLKGISMGYKGAKSVQKTLGTKNGRERLGYDITNISKSVVDGLNVKKNGMGSIFKIGGNLKNTVEGEDARRQAEKLALEARDQSDIASRNESKSAQYNAAGRLNKDRILNSDNKNLNSGDINLKDNYNIALNNLQDYEDETNKLVKDYEKLNKKVSEFNEKNGLDAGMSVDDMRTAGYTALADQKSDLIQDRVDLKRDINDRTSRNDNGTLKNTTGSALELDVKTTNKEIQGKTNIQGKEVYNTDKAASFQKLANIQRINVGRLADQTEAYVKVNEQAVKSILESRKSDVEDLEAYNNGAITGILNNAEQFGKRIENAAQAKPITDFASLNKRVTDPRVRNQSSDVAKDENIEKTKNMTRRTYFGESKK